MFSKCMESIAEQTYDNIVVIPHENEGGLPDYEYNLLCNDLKERVTEGWFFFLDDDDTLFNRDAIAGIIPYLKDPETAVICQFMRGTWPKPPHDFIRDEIIADGHIGLPCLILHHSKKHIADIQNAVNGDYLWIKEVADKMPVEFVQHVLVNSPKRNYGK
jgi:hypothetical protein